MDTNTLPAIHYQPFCVNAGTIEQATPRKRLLVAIPCLNESLTIGAVIAAIPRVIAGLDRVDVLVVDDGSTDDTSLIASKAGAMTIRHPVNLGVGAGFQRAVDYAVSEGYDFMVNIDGDGQFDPQDISRLVDPLVKGEADMATASRFVNPEFTPEMPRVKLVGNRMMSWLISQLVQTHYSDVSCGFRCYTRESLLRINLHGAFTYTQETFLDFSVKNIRIVEIPTRVIYFADRKSRVAGSILKYAINTAKIIFRGYRDYYPLRFFWSIAAALAVPAAIFAVVFFGHFLLTGTFKGFLFAGLLSAFFSVLSAAFLLVGVVADMLDRIRTNQDRVLYLLKKQQLPLDRE